MSGTPGYPEYGMDEKTFWELSSKNRLGEVEEDCGVCEEGWTFYCDLEDEDAPNRTLDREGKLLGDKWICPDCWGTHQAVLLMLSARVVR